MSPMGGERRGEGGRGNITVSVGGWKSKGASSTGKGKNLYFDAGERGGMLKSRGKKSTLHRQLIGRRTKKPLKRVNLGKVTSETKANGIRRMCGIREALKGLP